MPRVRLAIAICSVFVSLALGALWASTWWRGDVLCYLPIEPARYRKAASTGIILTPGGFDVAAYARGFPGGWGGSVLGFGVAGHGGVTEGADFVFCPFWFPVLTGLVPPVYWAWRRRRINKRGFAVEVRTREVAAAASQSSGSLISLDNAASMSSGKSV